MSELIGIFFNRYKIHLAELCHGMTDAEANYLDDKYTLKDFIEILEHRIRVGSAPIINQSKLARKYINGFCHRNNIDKYGMQNQIRNMKSTHLTQFDGNWYFSELQKRHRWII